MATRLLVLSSMDPSGATGVQTHVQQVMALAREQGIDARLCTPSDRPRTLAFRVVDRLVRDSASLSADFSHRRRTRLHDARLAANARAALQDVAEPVTLYANTPRSALAAHAASRSLGRNDRLVWTAHFYDSEFQEALYHGFTRRNGGFWRLLERQEARAMEIADAVTAPSTYACDRLKKRHPGLASKVRRVPNFIADPLLGAPVPLEGSTFDLINVGTLEPRKNQTYLLDILKEARGQGYELTLRLVGDGPDRECLVKKVSEYGLGDQVSFAGSVPDAAKLMTMARVYVHAAKAESFGISILEAMSSGLPVFAGRIGGIPDLLTDGVQGRFWPLDDPKTAASLLIGTLSSSQFAKLGVAGRERFLSTFTPQTAGQALLDVVLGDERVSSGKC